MLRVDLNQEPVPVPPMYSPVPPIQNYTLIPPTQTCLRLPYDYPMYPPSSAVMPVQTVWRTI